MNLRKLLKDKNKERKENITKSYMLQKPMAPPSYYRSRMKKTNKLAEMVSYKSQRHANSTETINRKEEVKLINVVHEDPDSGSPPLHITEVKSKITSSPVPKLGKSYKALVIDVDTPGQTSNPIGLSSAVGKAVKDMTPIEYFWAHKNKKSNSKHFSSVQTPAPKSIVSPSLHSSKAFLIYRN